MGATYGWGLNVPAEEISGTMLEIFKMGFKEEIIEVMDGKVVSFQFVNGEMQTNEIEDERKENILAIWGEGYLGSMNLDDWEILSRDSSSVFVPMEDSFFDSFENNSEKYVESSGDAVQHIEEFMNDMREDGIDEDDETQEFCREMVDKLRVAIENKFIFSVSY
jgi:hypothetical protein